VSLMDPKRRTGTGARRALDCILTGLATLVP
jgi:hypothetical protein